MDKHLRILQFTASIPDSPQTTSNSPIFVLNSTFKSYHRDILMQQLHLSPSDLRNLLILTSMIEPRKGQIIVSLNQIDCVITQNQLFLFMEFDDSQFAQEFPQLLKQAQILEKGTKFFVCFEILALEAIFLYVQKQLQNRMNKVRNQADKLKFQVLTRQAQAALALCQQELTSVKTDCQRAAQTILNTIQQSADSLFFENQRKARRTQNLVFTKITNKWNGKLVINQDQEIEDLIEGYLYQIRAVQMETEQTLKLIDDSLELAGINLDDLSNKMMRFELRMSFLANAFDVGAVIGGAFGMNVLLGWETSNFAFYSIMIATVIVGFIIFGGFVFAERKIIKNEKVHVNHFK
ncbi:Transmembrane domain-containing protein [Spironucleus salmonicida]|uniref:Transmembrane domain-containing protein n=1 Tax=Spironucleus salmonicida TaxID=348837 RepID=V6LBB3_9EUKA|nr:Transmembrane domain-containing protein [Spironucleus salmonicida]|eukprot:EST41735.1 Transmembrane domain-containing protein [Spironucleus salmonicida]